MNVYVNITDQVNTLSNALQYNLMVLNLIPMDLNFINDLDINLQTSCLNYLNQLQPIFQRFFPNIYLSENLGPVAVQTNQGFITQINKPTIAPLVYNFLYAFFAALYVTIDYYQLITTPEKLNIDVLLGLLNSFGIYDELLNLPISVLRKLSVLIVDFYLHKGTKRSVEDLMKAISFSPGEINEYYSYREGSYDSNNNLNFSYNINLSKQLNNNFVNTIMGLV